MRGKLTLLAGVCAGAIAFPAFAQEAADDAAAAEPEIIVTAQRTSQRLQDVPIAVSAFSAESLDRQQIKTTSDLQLTLPNVTFTKTNFTGSSFTIRGIGDLCVGVTCDAATAIHLNDAPLFSTRLFEGEFYDLAQVEVLRGPQGTLFGKNATSGVVNFRTARPDLGSLGAGLEVDYGNYDSKKVKGFVNVPLGETLALRVAGFYLSRDGYTNNLYDGSKIDDRDMYGVRGSLRFEPTDSTTVDLMVQYFHERDNRMRIQKQKCQTDVTGVLGCLNGRRDPGVTNGDSTLASILTSREFFAIRGLPTAFALGSLYDGNNVFSGAVSPVDSRTVNTDYTPTYFTDELIIQGSIEQEFGGGITLKVSGNYQDVNLDSRQDYNLSVQNRAGFAPALGALNAAAAGMFGPGLDAYLSPVAAALIPGGAAGPLCTSLPEETGTGIYGGHSLCTATPQDFDRSNQNNSSWTAEAIVSSDWDGMFNFLIGGIYGKYHLTENSYYVNSFGLDYFSGVVGAFSGIAGGLPPGFLATPFYRNNSDDLRVTSYGIFGEAYVKFSDDIKLTLGVRYNNDQKSIKARTSLWFDTNTVGAYVPHGSDSITDALNYAVLDYDPGRPGAQEFAIRQSSFSAWTGRAVLDWNITPDNLMYVSYSRGYKSGGINPPLSVGIVTENFLPEYVNAFEIGSKNSFGNLQLNLTGFYYQYKDLQLSRIVSRTSVNDNVSANIWGLEAEAVLRPTREFTVNINASYLNTEVSQDKFQSNPRDFGGQRADAVIIKDITNASNCAVGSSSGSVAGVNAFVGTVNSVINSGAVPGVAAGAGLQTSTYTFPSDGGIASRGAYSICSVLSAAAAGAFAGGGLNPAAFGGITYYSAGIPVNIKGNELPGAPSYKVSAGAQYAIPFGDDMTLTPRADVILTGQSSGSIFNGNVNRIPSYTQVNAQLQFDGPDRKWFIRGYVQNLFNDDPVTGLYVTDQSSGLFTNIFTLEPRRYGIAAGFKF